MLEKSHGGIGPPLSGGPTQLSAGTGRTFGGAEDWSGGVILNQDGAALAGLQDVIADP